MRKMSLNSENEAKPRRLGLVADLPGALESALGHRLPVGTAVCAGTAQNLLQPGAARPGLGEGPAQTALCAPSSSPGAMCTCIDHTFKPAAQGDTCGSVEFSWARPSRTPAKMSPKARASVAILTEETSRNPLGRTKCKFHLLSPLLFRAA